MGRRFDPWMFSLAVGGITEHLEVNIIPLGVCLTSRFYKTIHTFFFPKMEVENEGDGAHFGDR